MSTHKTSPNPYWFALGIAVTIAFGVWAIALGYAATEGFLRGDGTIWRAVVAAGVVVAGFVSLGLLADKWHRESRK